MQNIGKDKMIKIQFFKSNMAAGGHFEKNHMKKVLQGNMLSYNLIQT